MDKNMISIDELVKQRLGGREEKERPGGWLAMRDLLDKEMPVAAASATSGNIRRVIGYATALLLLAGISFGGKELFSKFRDNKAAFATNDNISDNSGIANSSAVNAPSIVNQTVTGKKTASNTTVSKTIATTNSTNKDKQTAENKLAHVSAANSIGNPKQPGSGNKNQNVNKGLATRVLSSNTANLTTNNNKINTQKTESISNNELNINKKEDVVASNNSGLFSNRTTTNDNKNTSHKPAPVPAPNSSLNNTAGNNKLPAKGNDEPKKPNQPVGNAAENNSTAKAAEMGGTKKSGFEMDSINKIETKQVYTGKGRYKTDTISKGKVAMARFSVLEDINDLMAVNKKQTADNLIVPAAAVPNAASEEKMVSLADHKVSSTHKNNGSYPTRFEEMVKNAKMNMNGISFYPGLLAGVNCSAVNGKPALGFQAGITGLVKMSERWSILTEIKYMNNITNRTTIDDGYNRDLQSQTDPANTAIITYRWDSVVHNFGYSSLSSVNMPIALRFSAGRMNVFGGLNMAYNFGVNIYDGGATYHKSETRPIDLGGFDWHAAPAKYDAANDFKAKFGIGYVIGASYQASPAMQVDLRVATQSLWNNAKTSGSKEVFNHLYRSPSLQLNASYRFSNSKYRRRH